VQIYFDTNVYRFVHAAGEVSLMRELLEAYGCTLTASGGNVFETLAIQSAKERRAELDVLVQVARRFTRQPSSWLHSVELKNELRCRRPSWIRRVLSSQTEKRVQALLRGHLRIWEMVRGGQLPPADAYALYRDDAEKGILTQRQFQKTIREFRSFNNVSVSLQDSSGKISDVDPSDPEIFWRLDGLMVWYKAIEGKDPSCRDYNDWLTPYMKPGSFRDPSYRCFWLQEASGDAMPLNKLVGLVNFYQLSHKVTHGNAADQLHAGHWLREELFVTADSAFYSVLKQIADVHFPQRPKPMFIDRQSPSCVKQFITKNEVPIATLIAPEATLPR
jgi:hypothetical protein